MEKQTGTVVVLGTDGMYGAWGRGSTKAEALRAARRNGNLDASKGYTVLTFDAESTVDGVTNMGDVRYHGNEPQVERVKPRKKA